MICKCYTILIIDWSIYIFLWIPEPIIPLRYRKMSEQREREWNKKEIKGLFFKSSETYISIVHLSWNFLKSYSNIINTWLTYYEALGRSGPELFHKKIVTANAP
jgi:hypothetical protein